MYSVVYIVHCTMYIVYNVRYIVYSLWYTLYIVYIIYCHISELSLNPILFGYFFIGNPFKPY